MRAWCTVMLVALVLHAFETHGAPARIPGGQWRSVLPTGTTQEQVTVGPFLLESTPVTNAEFLEFVRTHPRWQRGRVPKTLADAGYLRQWSGPLTLGAVQPRQPVTAVSWFAARAFCEARGQRLPTWYEWELAAAADENEPDARHRASWQQRILSWYSRPSNRALEAVAAGRPNVHGIHDLHGLVWEWVEDFNALMISGDNREQGDPDVLKYCGSGALAIEDRDSYAVMMRLALLSSLEANATTINLGFRCAQDAEGTRQ
jgi:formylglycine-generating enzyme